MILALALAAAAFPAAASEPRFLNIQDVFKPEDYPLSALNSDHQGAATVRVRVGRDGLATDCTITKSSGHAALDAQSCALILARAQFEPARDAAGRSIAGIYENQVTWRMSDQDDPQAYPRQAWSRLTTMTFAEGKGLVACKHESVGLPTAYQDCTGAFRAQRGDVAVPGAGGVSVGNPRADWIASAQFYPLSHRQVVVPPSLADAVQTAQQVSAITIESDGQVSRCEGIRYSGIAGPQNSACGIANRMRFTSVEPGSPALDATFIFTTYDRRSRPK